MDSQDEIVTIYIFVLVLASLMSKVTLGPSTIFKAHTSMVLFFIIFDLFWIILNDFVNFLRIVCNFM